MLYHIKPEFVILWGANATTETIITEDQIREFSQCWAKSIRELKKQLEPIRSVNLCIVGSNAAHDRVYLTPSRSALVCAEKYGRCEAGEYVRIYSSTGKLIDKAFYGTSGKYYRVNI